MARQNPKNLPLVLEESFNPPSKWEIAAQVLAFNGWKKGFTKNGAFALAAQMVEVHQSTLALWTRDPRFMELVEMQSAKLVTLAVRGLTKMLNTDVAACKHVLTNLQPNRWDSQRRNERLRHRLQTKLARELRAEVEDKIGPCPVPVYHSAASLPDPDNGERPRGYEEFTNDEQ